MLRDRLHPMSQTPERPSSQTLRTPAVTDMAQMPMVEPTRPVLVWLARSMLLGWSLQRLAFSLFVFLVWEAVLRLSVLRPGGLMMLASLLPAALLGTVGALFVVRNTALELGCDRRRPVFREYRFVSHMKRSAAGAGVVLACFSAVVYGLLSMVLIPPATWTLSVACWWVLTPLCLAAIASDGADAIDAFQRVAAYMLHRPLDMVLLLVPVVFLALGVAVMGWVAVAGPVAFIFSALGGAVVTSLLLCSCQGMYMALRYANDRQDPAEIIGSGSEHGVLTTTEPNDAH